MKRIKEKTIKNLDAVCNMEGLQCPICGTSIQKAHINAEWAIIRDAEIVHNMEDLQKLRGEIDFENFKFTLFPPYSIGFSCTKCNANVLIEKNEE